MKQHKIIEAYNATERLADSTTLPVKTMWELYDLRRKLTPHKEFQADREQALRQKYMPYANSEGVINGTPYIEFMQECGELDNLEIDVADIQRISLPLTDGLGLTVHDIEALEPFVDFLRDDVCKTAP